MHPSLKALLAMQAIDGELIFLRRAREKRPQELDEVRRRMEEKKRLVEAVIQESKKLKMEGDRRELDLKQNEADVLKLQVQLNQAKTNQEYQVLKEQIGRLRGENDRIQDEVLSKLSQAENLEGGRRKAEEALKAVQAEYKKKEEELRGIIESLDGQMKELDGQRTEALRSVPADHMAIYDRVLNRHKDFALARVDNQICQGCFMAVTPQMINLLMQDKEMCQCRNCLRILYLA